MGEQIRPLLPNELSFLRSLVREYLRKKNRSRRRLAEKFGNDYDQKVVDSHKIFGEALYRTLGGDPRRIENYTPFNTEPDSVNHSDVEESDQKIEI